MGEHGRSPQEVHTMPYILGYFPHVPKHLPANALTLGVYRGLYGLYV